MADSTNQDFDPLSDLLRLTDARPVLSGGFTAGGRWGLRFPEPDKIKFFALVKGFCWLQIEGEHDPLHIEMGDIILLSGRRTFTLSSDLAASPFDAASIFPPGSSKFATIGHEEECVQIGGHVRLDLSSGGLLSDVLPQLIHVKATNPHASVLQWLLQQLVQEQSLELPGSGLATTQLAQLMFVQILRVYLETDGSSAMGLLRIIGDKRIAPAIRLMHKYPSRSWHLEDLAKAAAMSRTTFASYFKKVAGVGPLTYLMEWRIRLAERELRDERTAVSTLGHSLGYTSESAFSRAFKRVVGVAPKNYRGSIKSRSALEE